MYNPYNTGDDDDDNDLSNNLSKQFMQLGCLIVGGLGLFFVIVAIVAIISFWRSGSISSAFIEKIDNLQTMQEANKTVFKKLALDVNNLKKRVATIESEIQSIEQLPPESKVRANLAAIDAKLTTVDSRINMFESVFENDPERMLTVALLRKDLENIKAELKYTTYGIQEEFKRSNENVRLIIYGLFTIVAAIAGAVFALLFRPLTQPRMRWLGDGRRKHVDEGESRPRTN